MDAWRQLRELIQAERKFCRSTVVVVVFVNAGSTIFYAATELLAEECGNVEGKITVRIDFKDISCATFGNVRAAIEVVVIFDSDVDPFDRSEEHTSELQSRGHLVCRLLLEKKMIISV